MIVPFAPGGISDVLGRLIAQRLGSSLGQQVVVDNRPGAGTLIGSGIVTKANPDGYTIMIQDMTTHAINATLYARLPYDSVKDFTGITLVAQTPLMLVVNQSLPVKSVAELTGLIRSRGGKFNYGSSGNGTILHLASESYRMAAKLDMAVNTARSALTQMQTLGIVREITVKLGDALSEGHVVARIEVEESVPAPAAAPVAAPAAKPAAVPAPAVAERAPAPAVAAAPVVEASKRA
jgi:tripartite-type tricarboxylate transporter receptor subunit TctC